MTKWVTALIAANVGVFFLQYTIPGVTEALILRPELALLRPWTLFTYMFLHGGFWHIALNMWGLYVFGPRLETLLGGPRFITLYLLSGLGGALLSFVPPFYFVGILGASGAVLGVVTAYARVWPDQRLYFYGIVPILAWWIPAGYALYSIAGFINPSIGAGTAHFGHLGGIVVGYAYMALLSRHSAAKRFQRQASAMIPIASESEALRRWNAIPVSQLHELNRGEVIRLLEKVRAQGVKRLSPEERATLDRFSLS